MKKLKCYYAHTMLSYGSTIEKDDIMTLEALGFEVLNPNQKWVQEGCEAHIELHGKDKAMDYFKKLIDQCDLIAFRSNPDGTILSGVGFELKYAIDECKPIIELPCSLQNRIKDYTFTKRYLIEIGHYKTEDND